jgi:hypothetical protein
LYAGSSPRTPDSLTACSWIIAAPSVAPVLRATCKHNEFTKKRSLINEIK